MRRSTPRERACRPRAGASPLAVAVLSSVLLLSTSPKAQPQAVCSICDPVIELSRPRLHCLSVMLPVLLEEAARTDPVLVPLFLCEGDSRFDDERRSGDNLPDEYIQDIHELIARHEPVRSRHAESDRQQEAAFAYLSRAQLRCVERDLEALVAAEADPTRVDFQDCPAP